MIPNIQRVQSNIKVDSNLISVNFIDFNIEERKGRFTFKKINEYKMNFCSFFRKKLNINLKPDFITTVLINVFTIHRAELTKKSSETISKNIFS